jgi:DNA replication protein DnaC
MSDTKDVVQEPPHLLHDLKELKLPSVAAGWRRMAEESRRGRLTHPQYLAELMRQELIDREERRIRRRVCEARFPVLKTLDGFDFAASGGLDRDEVLALFDCRFVEERGNVVFVGGVGTGKTHLSVALGLACCQRSHRVRFVTAAELTNELVEAKQRSRLGRVLERMARYDVVVLDELGYVPFDKEGADLLFGFITKVYERRSLIVTTNLPFGRWGEVFRDATAAAAVIDRIVHHAVVLTTDGESYRLRDATRKTTARQGRRKPGARAGGDGTKEVAPR